MGIREKMNSNPKPFVIGAGVVLALGIFVMIRSIWPSGPSTPARPTSKIYFTDDDGKTYFPGSFDLLAEADGPNGKPAYWAHVYQYKGEKPFVGWMENYAPDGKEILKRYYADPSNKGTAPPQTSALERNREMKRPGDSRWTPATDPMAMRVSAMERKDGELPTQISPPEK